jgi:hypothetical protein
MTARVDVLLFRGHPEVVVHRARLKVLGEGRWIASALCFAFGLSVLGAGCDAAKRAVATNRSASSRQALRVCVDRWNQGNMLRWRSMSVRISIRGLYARERSVLSEPNPAQRRCTLSLAARPGQNTWICIIDDADGYECPLVTSDGMPPLRNTNGMTDGRGVLKLDVPLAGTHAAPPLAWQRRYPHVDGFILPWTRAAKLRQGLSFDRTGEARHYRGHCFLGSQQTVTKAALRCVSDVQFDPCFAPSGDRNHLGTVVACAYPGGTRFSRFVIVRRL